MSESDRVAVACPSCGEETVHEVLREGGQSTVRCTDCDHVHKTRIEQPREYTRDVVVSQDGDSFSATVDVPEGERLAVGEEFVLETDEAILTVRITSLELDSGRAESAPIEDVETIWTRDVGNVAVDVTVHPKSGTGEDTESVELYVPGDHEFVVGEREARGDREFSVEGIHVRDDAAGYEENKLDRPGRAVPAKDVKRVYARDETTLRSPW